VEWIFQGNPSRYNVDDYLARYPELIYWHCPKFRKEVAVGDVAYIWRAGGRAGAVAKGEVVETAVERNAVAHPEALGDDLWRTDKPDETEVKVGIRLVDIRLSDEEGMISRDLVKNDPVLAASTIITMPNSTVFRLRPEEATALELLWGGSYVSADISPVTARYEGKRVLAAHWRRERSRFLVEAKVAWFLEKHNSLRCEICGMADSRYPKSFGRSVFEVHHKAPLAAAATPVRTTLEELMLLCASCHRAIHANGGHADNMGELVAHFGRKI
jgi:hypothetical protein